MYTQCNISIDRVRTEEPIQIPNSHLPILPQTLLTCILSLGFALHPMPLNKQVRRPRIYRQFVFESVDV